MSRPPSLDPPRPRRRHWPGVAGLAAVLAAAPALPAHALDGVVVHVTDGDTLWLRTPRQPRPSKVRLQGIDAPELCQAGGAQARQALEALVLGRRVSVRLGPPDAYGRRLVQVQVGPHDVAAELVAAGWAWSAEYRERPGRYAALERAARQARVGVFADPEAIPPRTFRQTHGSCIGPFPAQDPTPPRRPG